MQEAFQPKTTLLMAAKTGQFLGRVVQIKQIGFQSKEDQPHYPVSLANPRQEQVLEESAPLGFTPNKILREKDTQRHLLEEGKSMRRKEKVLSQKAKLFIAT